MKKILALLMMIVVILVGCVSYTKTTIVTSVKPSWGTLYTTLLQKGKDTDPQLFKDLQSTLSKIREESKATYVYVLMPIKDGVASLEGDIKGKYMLTIDGSKEPEDWGVTYDYEAQFSEAWSGEVAAARSAWNDGDIQNWSAFAPIYNAEKKVVAILGIDYPATEVIQKYPEWNRDDEKWNHMEDKISVPVPNEVQNKIDEVKVLVKKYANTLQQETSKTEQSQLKP